MRNFIKSGAVIGVIAALICVPFATSAQAQEYFEAREPGGGAMMYDMVVVRPVGLVATAVGSVFWLISLPFSASGDNTEKEKKKLVKEQILHFLSLRIPATPNIHDIAWNYEEGKLWFFTNLKAANEDLETLFAESFKLSLIRYFPYTAAELAADLSDAEKDKLNRISPDNFMS